MNIWKIFGGKKLRLRVSIESDKDDTYHYAAAAVVDFFDRLRFIISTQTISKYYQSLGITLLRDDDGQVEFSVSLILISFNIVFTLLPKQ